MIAEYTALGKNLPDYPTGCAWNCTCERCLKIYDRRKAILKAEIIEIEKKIANGDTHSRYVSATLIALIAAIGLFALHFLKP